MTKKLKTLRDILKGYRRVAIAFSGGVDSSFLTFYARKILGKDNLIALTIDSPYIPRWELKEAIEFTQRFDINHSIIKLDIPEEVIFNPEGRCYICKRKVFSSLLAISKKGGFILCDGTNADDVRMIDRPGLKALKELGVKSPLAETNLSKKEIRMLSKKFKLPTWKKAPYACLLTRLPFNNEIQTEKLKMIDEAEKFLIDMGFKLVRVRCHDNLARIEVGDSEMKKILKPKILKNISKKLKQIGFLYVSLDCEGYKTGGANG